MIEMYQINNKIKRLSPKRTVSFVMPFLIVLIIMGCEKEYFPDSNADRDEDLYGTWISIDDIREHNPSVWVYTQEGYCGLTYCLNPEERPGLQVYINIDGIWYNDDEQIIAQGRFKSDKWKYQQFYEVVNDTLILTNKSGYTTKKVKFRNQLRYRGAGFVTVEPED